MPCFDIGLGLLNWHENHNAHTLTLTHIHIYIYNYIHISVCLFVSGVFDVNLGFIFKGNRLGNV
jgi:hypothetical protein